MLNNEGQAASVVTMLAPGDKANTAAATGGWIDVRNYEGDLTLVVMVGTVSAGQIVPSFQDATDGSGTGAAAITPNEGALITVTTANDPLIQKSTINRRATRGWIRFLGTITTGPVECGAALLARPKNF